MEVEVEVHEDHNTISHTQAILLGIWGTCTCGGNLRLKYNEFRTSGELKCKTCDKSHGRFEKEITSVHGNKRRHCNSSI